MIKNDDSHAPLRDSACPFATVVHDPEGAFKSAAGVPSRLSRTCVQLRVDPVGPCAAGRPPWWAASRRMAGAAFKWAARGCPFV